MERNKVVLVDQEDRAIGEMDKLRAHELGKLHRAFSIFIFNGKGEMLIHQRAADKYHGGNLWTNACCSHPQQGESLHDAALQRLQFEMGMSCALEQVFSFTYHAVVENDLIEHEFDHVFVGETEQNPKPNSDEVQDYRWITIDHLRQEIRDKPESFTFWFKSVLEKVLHTIKHDPVISFTGK